jgi:hypothetical protein
MDRREGGLGKVVGNEGWKKKTGEDEKRGGVGVEDWWGWGWTLVSIEEGRRGE